MATSKVLDSLQRINDQAGRELDGMAQHLPPVPAPALSFDEYLPRALEYAKTDERFARELARALHQTQRYGG